MTLFSKKGLGDVKDNIKNLITEIKGAAGIIIDDAGYEAVVGYNDWLRDGKIDKEGKWFESFSDEYKKAFAQNPELSKQFETLRDTADGAAVKIHKCGDAYSAFGKGIKGAIPWIKSFAAQMGAMLLQFALITAAIWAIGKAIEWAKNNIPTTGNVRNWAEESAEALADTKSEIESLNSELKTTQDRIAELKSKGHLTLTEQEELERLKKTNVELERQLLIKRELEKSQSKDAAEKAVDALHTYDKTYSNDANEASVISASNGKITIPEQMRRYAALYQQAKADAANVDLDSSDAEKQIDNFNQKADEAKEKFEELVTATGDYLLSARDNFEYLSEDEQSYVRQIENAIIATQHKMGQISTDDAFSVLLSDDAYEEFNAKLQSMAANGEEVSGKLSDYFSDDAIKALQNLGCTADDVNEHIKALANVGDFIDNQTTEAELRKIQEIVKDTDFEITDDSIKEQFGEDFIRRLEEAGLSVDEFRSYLVSLQNQVDKMDLSDLKSVEDGINAIGEAVNEFRDNSGKVSAATLAELTESLSPIADTKEFENFINVVGNAKSTTAELNAALDDLIDKYLDTQAGLAGLKVENEALYTAQLKQMGVVNAESVVRVKLAKSILNDANATEEAKDRAYELINAMDAQETQLYNTASASLTSAQNLQILQIQMQLVKSGDFTDTMRNNASAIVALGTVAGKNAEDLVKYANILMQIATIQDTIKKMGNNPDALKSMNTAMGSLMRSLAELEQSAKTQFDNLFTGVNSDADLKVAPSKGKKETAAEKNKDKYDAAKKKLDYQLEQRKISYDKYYKELVKLGDKYLKKEKGNAQDLRDHYSDLTSVRKSAFEDAKNKLDQQLEGGTITIEKYYTKIEALIKKWYKGRKASAQDAVDAELELQKQLADSWKDRISKQETQFDRMTLDKVWPSGKSELDYWKKMMEKLQKDYRKGMFKDKEAYLELYYDLLEKIQSAEKDLAQKQLDDVTKRITAIDDLVEMTSKMLKQRIEDEIDALEKMKDAYSDIVDVKKESLQLTKDELAYQQEISDMNEELTKLQAQAELLKLDDSRAGRAKYAELMEQIREKQKDISDKQADHTYDATVDALDKADEAYQKFIEDRIEALNKQMENQGEWLRYVYSYIESTNPSQLLNELKAYNYKYGDGINQTVDKIWNSYIKYADAVYGNSGYLVQILEELRNLEIKYQDQVDAASGEDDKYPSDNYKSNLSEAVMHKNIAKNTDEQNMALRDQVQNTYGGSWWWDPEHQQIYRSDTANKYLISAASYPLIQQMKSINNNSSLSKTARKKQLDAILKTLKKTYYGFTQAHLEAGKNGKYHLYKRSGKDSNWQIFHDGINAGYTGADYVPSTKQNELLALLKKGELVFNKENQNHLLSQLQAVENFQKAFKGITPGSISQTNYNSAPVSVGGVTIQIYGNATQDTVQALRKEAENISNMTMNKLQAAMVQKGYGAGAARGTFKR